MASPLLETKFHVPRRRRELVERPRLSERLTRGGDATLVLVSAPAGFGKTTLLTDWLAAVRAEGRATAWLSLDSRDNDPALFWAYLIAGLQRAAPGVDAGAASLLESRQAPIETVLAGLLNDLDALSEGVVLVLDDYHVIEASDIHAGMAFLVEHLPPGVQLVIASRADPPWPLARLRARGEIVEIRSADLRFTAEESADFLNGVMGLALTAADVAALDGRTEGWVAALQLAALSMQGRDDVAGFIAGFAGDDRYIVDYLAGEVLERQPESVRRFLLETSVLGRLSGALCDALTGQDGSQAMLEALERGNLFIVPLDDRRRWYRYHHLFADVLQARLRDEQPARAAELHRRASDWYEHEGERPEAIRHAMAGRDVERVAELIELAMPAMRRARREATVRQWLEALPEEVFARRPVLSIGFAGVLMSAGAIEGVDARLRDAERWLDPDVAAEDMVVVDVAEFASMPATVAMFRSGLARIVGDVDGTIAHARRVLDLVEAGDHYRRGAASALLGLAYWTRGDLDAGHRWYAEGLAHLEKAGHLSDVLGCAIAVADIRIAQGRLRDAMGLYERGLRLAGEGGPPLRGSAEMHVGISELLREGNDLAGAVRQLEAARAMGEPAGLPQYPYRWRVAMALVRMAEGDVAGALDLLDEAERLFNGDYFPEVRPVAAVKARLWVLQGDVGGALRWAQERNLSADDDLTYLREFEHVTLARALLAGQAEEAVPFLERLLAAAEAGKRTGSEIEILVLLALARKSLAPLRRALDLAEPEGYVRVFLDEGRPMAALLSAAARQGVAPEHARRLLASAGGPPGRQPLVEPLSERELEVLRLLRTELSGPDIARELTVSLNTMRTHTKSIFTKLGVNNRRAAVRRAEELDL